MLGTAHKQQIMSTIKPLPSNLTCRDERISMQCSALFDGTFLEIVSSNDEEPSAKLYVPLSNAAPIVSAYSSKFAEKAYTEHLEGLNVLSPVFEVMGSLIEYEAAMWEELPRALNSALGGITHPNFPNVAFEYDMTMNTPIERDGECFIVKLSARHL